VSLVDVSIPGGRKQTPRRRRCSPVCRESVGKRTEPYIMVHVGLFRIALDSRLAPPQQVERTAMTARFSLMEGFAVEHFIGQGNISPHAFPDQSATLSSAFVRSNILDNRCSPNTLHNPGDSTRTGVCFSRSTLARRQECSCHRAQSSFPPRRVSLPISQHRSRLGPPTDVLPLEPTYRRGPPQVSTNHWPNTAPRSRPWVRTVLAAICETAPLPARCCSRTIVTRFDREDKLPCRSAQQDRGSLQPGRTNASYGACRPQRTPFHPSLARPSPQTLIRVVAPRSARR